MSVQVETMEKNLAKLTVQTSAEELEKAIQQAFLKNRNRFNVPGFRKGKVPRAMIEKMYGKGVFYEEAVNSLLPGAYSAAAKESGLEIVSRPEIEVNEVEAGKGVSFTAIVAVKPEVTLGQYKGVEVTKIDTEPTEEEVMAEIRKEQEKNATMAPVEDRPAAMGDTVTIDYEGFIDGEAFEGGKGEDHDLVLGSHSFIDTFEDQLVGKNAGDEAEVNVTFPAQYHAKELQNKPALFKVSVKAIRTKELPEIDDEFASEVSEFDTLEEYKADIKAKIKEQKAAEGKTKQEDQVVEQAVKNASYEIPDAMIDTQVSQMEDEFSQRIRSQGLSMEQYFQFTGMTKEKMSEEMRPQAVKRIETRLVLEAIAKAESIEITDEKLDEEIAKMAEAYKMEADKLKEFMGEGEKKQMKEDMAVQEAITFLRENAVEK